MFAQTEHLTLRGFEPSDADTIFRMFNDPAVARTASTDYLVPQGTAYKEKLVKSAEEALCYVVLLKRGTDEFVGIASLAPYGKKDRAGMFGIALVPECWGKGYGTEATRWIVDWGFHQLALHRVMLTAIAVNERALDLYRRIGFVEEGRWRKMTWMDGEWKDMVWMGMLEDEWRQR